MALVAQYIIVRKDLMTKLHWPVGAVISQCCQATDAVLAQYENDDDVIMHLKDVDNMHKIVLEVKDEAELIRLSKAFKTHEIEHILKIEKAINTPTCIAVKPYRPPVVRRFVHNFKELE